MASQEPKQNHPSTYFVHDRTTQHNDTEQKELRRLQIVDQITTAGMGGVLSEQPDPALFKRVLDVGCGTGGWLIELARTVPSTTKLVGIDPGVKYIEYARAQAEVAQVSNRVEFQVGDALRKLEFPNAFFDLVNHRLASSWLRTWDWPRLLQEYKRVVHPNGVIRITEPDVMVIANRPALTRISELFLQAFYKAGHAFTLANDGVSSELAHLLQQQGLQQVQTRSYTIQHRAGTLDGELFFEDMRIFYQNLVPFLRKWIDVPPNYDEIYQQMLIDMQQPDYMVTWGFVTAWGKMPQSRK